MNIFAPKASVQINGGGSSTYNFVGRLWVDSWTSTGSSVKIQVSGEIPATFGCDTTVNLCPLSGTPDMEYIGRSISYSSAF